MLLNCRATHVCWVIWGAEFDADIHFYIWTEERSPSGQKFGQVRSNFKVQNVLTKICLSCAVLYKDSKNVIHFFGTTIRNAKNVFKKCDVVTFTWFLAIEQPENKILFWNFVLVMVVCILIVYIPFFG